MAIEDAERAIEAVRGNLPSGIVDRDVYTDPAVLELEKERIFTRTWHYACTVHDLKKPGDFFTLSIVDQPIIVLRGRDQRIRAFYNVCTHRGAILTGETCGNYGLALKCMYHAWSFSLSGELTGVPYPEGYGPDFDRSKFGLVPVQCDTFYDLVFVAIDPLIPSLTDYLGEAVDHLAPYVDGIEPIGRNSFIFEGNWKMWHENFRDNYHPEFTHRMIHDMTPHFADRGGNWGLSPGHSKLQWISEEANMERYRSNLQRRSGVSFEGISTPNWGPYVEWPEEIFAIFPNFDVQPDYTGKGRTKAGYLQTVVPLGVDRSRVDLTVLAPVGEDPHTRQWHLENLADGAGSWGKIACDDTEAAARCQVGMYGRGTRVTMFTRGTAPGRGGPQAQSRDEYSSREFYRVYQQYLDPEMSGR